MTADGGCGVSWSYHYLRYCGTGKGNHIILQRGRGRGREEPCLGADSRQSSLPRVWALFGSLLSAMLLLLDNKYTIRYLMLGRQCTFVTLTKAKKNFLCFKCFF